MSTVTTIPTREQTIKAIEADYKAGNEDILIKKTAILLNYSQKRGLLLVGLFAS